MLSRIVFHTSKRIGRVAQLTDEETESLISYCGGRLAIQW